MADCEHCRLREAEIYGVEMHLCRRCISAFFASPARFERLRAPHAIVRGLLFVLAAAATIASAIYRAARAK
jgi:hypothetical protein